MLDVQGQMPDVLGVDSEDTTGKWDQSALIWNVFSFLFRQDLRLRQAKTVNEHSKRHKRENNLTWAGETGMKTAMCSVKRRDFLLLLLDGKNKLSITSELMIVIIF